MAITWRNVDASQMGAANNLLSSATNQIGNAGRGLVDALASYEQGNLAKGRINELDARYAAEQATLGNQFDQRQSLQQQTLDASKLRDANQQEDTLADNIRADAFNLASGKRADTRLDADLASTTRANTLADTAAAKAETARLQGIATEDLVGSLDLKFQQAGSLEEKSSVLNDTLSAKLRPQDKAAVFGKFAGAITQQAGAQFDAAHKLTLDKMGTDADIIVANNKVDPSFSFRDDETVGAALSASLAKRGLSVNEGWTGLAGESLERKVLALADKHGYNADIVRHYIENAPTFADTWTGDKDVDKEDLKGLLEQSALAYGESLKRQGIANTAKQNFAKAQQDYATQKAAAAFPYLKPLTK